MNALEILKAKIAEKVENDRQEKLRLAEASKRLYPVYEALKPLFGLQVSATVIQNKYPVTDTVPLERVIKREFVTKTTEATPYLEIALAVDLFIHVYPTYKDTEFSTICRTGLVNTAFSATTLNVYGVVDLVCGFLLTSGRIVSLPD